MKFRSATHQAIHFLITFLLALSGIVSAQSTLTSEPPYPDNRTFPASTFPFIREGQVQDRSATGQNPQVGIPIGGIFQYSLRDPATADVDYFVSAATTTSAKTYTLLATAMPDTYTIAGGNTYTVPRGVCLDLSASATASVTVTGVDQQGNGGYAETFTWTATHEIQYSRRVWSRITSITSTSDTNVTLTVGTSNTFGTIYPWYSNQGIVGVLWDADGADFPNTPLTQGGILPGQTSTTAVANYVPFASHRVWDAFATNLPGTAATDDLGLVTLASTVGTDWAVAIQTANMDNNDAVVPYYSAFTFTLPPTYVSGGAVSLIANAGMITTVADVSCTIDFEVFEYGAPTTDLCATAAQSINSLTAADKTFTITPTSLVAGDQLLVRQTIAGRDDTATGSTIGRSNSIRFASLQNAGATSASSPLYTLTPGDPTSTTLDRFGTALLGASNAVGATGAPDGTADYAIWVVPNDYRGVINSQGIAVYDTN